MVEGTEFITSIIKKIYEENMYSHMTCDIRHAHSCNQ